MDRTASALRHLIALVGLPAASADRVSTSGTEPVLPTRYRLGIPAVASLGALGAAVSELWVLRGGQRQTARVDMRAAVASLRGQAYVKVDGAKPADDRDPCAGFYQDRADRWVYIHCGFPNLREAAARVLGVEASKGNFERACRERDGRDLEAAGARDRACIPFVRTVAEWETEPQATAVAGLPLVDIRRIGDAPPRPFPAGDRPLSGVRVLDLTRVIAGPTCARSLAEHGADVLKISCADLPGSGPLDLATGMGKLATFLDLRQSDDAAILRQLISTADVFSQSYRPGTLAARGLSPEALAELRPGIVYTTLSAWGHDGPWRDWRGFDTVVQAASGMADLSARNGRPAFLPVSALDYLSGYLMALGTIAALCRRATEGGSWQVRVSLASTQHWLAGFGLFAPEEVCNLPSELPDDEIANLSFDMDSPFGRVTHLAPVLQLSETPAFWARPPVPLGYNSANWP